MRTSQDLNGPHQLTAPRANSRTGLRIDPNGSPDLTDDAVKFHGAQQEISQDRGHVHEPGLPRSYQETRGSVRPLCKSSQANEKSKVHDHRYLSRMQQHERPQTSMVSETARPRLIAPW
jgi:hypothetical protein